MPFWRMSVTHASVPTSTISRIVNSHSRSSPIMLVDS